MKEVAEVLRGRLKGQIVEILTHEIHTGLLLCRDKNGGKHYIGLSNLFFFQPTEELK